MHSNNEYLYLDTKQKIGNSNPRPFNLSHQTSQDNEEKSFSKQNSIDFEDNRQIQEALNSRRQSNNDNEHSNSRRHSKIEYQTPSNPRRSSSNTETIEKSYSRQYSNENKENK